ncbi:hypothetical protein [Paraburkholderia dioscoreae]|uniref:Uncharacterized protein n=1 Tax=Paraburkholderia dioscoreae TaxID=2604047 RepID=A0A5Q4Z9F8_9BURK|nr:hypothetical protein [Paraburkholderia dioscoreae]VVD31039.1 conserved protein of unknown function [Paraburkholderia dioscoreae]
MSWITDKLALILGACACAAAAWAILHYSREWFFPVVTVIAIVCFYVDNRRLRSLLKEHGIDPQRTKRGA